MCGGGRSAPTDLLTETGRPGASCAEVWQLSGGEGADCLVVAQVVQVPGGDGDAGVAEQGRDDGDRHAGLFQLPRERVPQAVRVYVRNLLHRLGGRAGIDKRVHPHGLRHTFADELRRSGVDVVIISKLLGHSSIAVTNRYLDHLGNHQAISALEAVELPDLGA
jgi:hypothetical protein